MFAQWGLPHCAFFDKRKRGENAVNENQEKTTAEVVTLEKTQPASEFVLEMTDIEKQFPGVKAAKFALTDSRYILQVRKMLWKTALRWYIRN